MADMPQKKRTPDHARLARNIVAGTGIALLVGGIAAIDWRWGIAVLGGVLFAGGLCGMVVTALVMRRGK